VEVFALAAAIAGIGGFLLAGWKGTVGKDDFSLLTGTLSALPVLLLAVVGGINVVSGAMIGALILVAIPQIAADYPSLSNLMILLPGLVGLTLARNPDGLASDLRNALRDARERLARRRRILPIGVLEVRPRVIAELVGLREPATDSDRRALQRELGFRTDECDGTV
jgi:branched-chain amino acid transport system permease protein